MSEQRIPGRNGTATIVGTSYSVFGEIAGLPEPTEDPSKWRSPEFNYSGVFKRYGLNSDAEYDRLRADGFPAPDKSGRGPASLRWRAEKVLEWEARIRGIAARLPKR